MEVEHERVLSTKHLLASSSSLLIKANRNQIVSARHTYELYFAALFCSHRRRHDAALGNKNWQ
jgi:hypothetical protein